VVGEGAVSINLEHSMNDRAMAIIIVGLGFAGFLYTFLNPAAVKRANETNYRRIGFGKKPIWFWRTLGAIGSLIGGWVLLQVILSKPN
jgi:hypothetical protein